MKIPLRLAGPSLGWLALAVILVVAGATPARSERVTAGLVAYHPFSEGGGDVVFDRSPTPPHTDLVFEGGVTWLPSDNGVSFAGGRVGSSEAASGLVSALQATSQASFEVWVAPGDLVQSGPARMLAISNGPLSGEFDYVFGQDQDDVQVRLRHTAKDAALKPRLTTSDGFLTTGLVHLVHTFDGANELLYVNGIQHPTTVASSGDFSGWSLLRLLSIGNTPTLDRSWNGTFRMAAIYDRALSAAEVMQNFQAGPDVATATGVPITVDAGPDQTTPSTPGLPPSSALLRGVVDDPDATGPVSSLWTQVSGATPVSFGDATSPETTVTLPQAGTYVFELAASDELRQTADRVTVTVPAQTGSPALNLYPAPLATAPTTPTLEVDCPSPAPLRGHFLIATDAAFSTVVYDSGASPTDVCSHVAFAELAPSTQYYWSARWEDDMGVWTDWSVPTGFETGGALVTLSFQDGVDGYTGTTDVDIRGDFQNPQQAIFEWNQGAQDILRTGRRPPGDPDEMYRALVRFELPPLDPDAIANAWLELTGWKHGPPSVFFRGATSFYELRTPWGEGDGLFGEPPQPGEASWTYSAYAVPWSVPGAADPGVDRGATTVSRARITNEVGAVAVVSGEAFVELVRQWADDPSSNHGVLFEAEDVANQPVLKIASREHPDPAFRPRLVVLPEPGFAISLAAGCVLVGALARVRTARRS